MGLDSNEKSELNGAVLGGPGDHYTHIAPLTHVDIQVEADSILEIFHGGPGTWSICHNSAMHGSPNRSNQ
jgi:hypothetical protein